MKIYCVFRKFRFTGKHMANFCELQDAKNYCALKQERAEVPGCEFFIISIEYDPLVNGPFYRV